jgi:Pyruvate/2-oxoacid:ferredoxin oxidoreductase delta subunit
MSKPLTNVLVKCGQCRFYCPDSEYEGLGDCKNPEVRGTNARVILKYCDEFYIAHDFGCIFGEPST